MELKLRPSCPGYGERICLSVRISALADLIAKCRLGRYSQYFRDATRNAMTNACIELVCAHPTRGDS